MLNGPLSLESAINCQNWCLDILLKDFPLRHYMWYSLPALSTFARRQGALLHSMYLLTPETLFCKVRVSRKQSILQLIIQHFRFIYILCDISFYNITCNVQGNIFLKCYSKVGPRKIKSHFLCKNLIPLHFFGSEPNSKKVNLKPAITVVKNKFERLNFRDKRWWAAGGSAGKIWQKIS